jgi:hypothetical protein
MSITETVKNFQTKLVSFLSEKPMWAYWIAFTILTGVSFGLIYILMALLTLKWWIPIITILAAGMIWGTVTFKGFPKKNDEP